MSKKEEKRRRRRERLQKERKKKKVQRLESLSPTELERKRQKREKRRARKKQRFSFTKESQKRLQESLDRKLSKKIPKKLTKPERSLMKRLTESGYPRSFIVPTLKITALPTARKMRLMADHKGAIYSKRLGSTMTQIGEEIGRKKSVVKLLLALFWKFWPEVIGISVEAYQTFWRDHYKEKTHREVLSIYFNRANTDCSWCTILPAEETFYGHCTCPEVLKEDVKSGHGGMILSCKGCPHATAPYPEEKSEKKIKTRKKRSKILSAKKKSRKKRRRK